MGTHRAVLSRVGYTQGSVVKSGVHTGQCGQEWGTHRAVLALAFNLSTWEREAGRTLSVRPAWSTELLPGQPGLHRETQKTKQKQE